MDDREEIRLYATLDSLYDFGWPLEILLRTAKAIGVSWKAPEQERP